MFALLGRVRERPARADRLQRAPGAAPSDHAAPKVGPPAPQNIIVKLGERVIDAVRGRCAKFQNDIIARWPSTNMRKTDSTY